MTAAYVRTAVAGNEVVGERVHREGGQADESGVTFRLVFSWWFHPMWIAAIFVAILPLSALVPKSAFELWKTPTYIDTPTAFTGFLSGLCLLIGLSVFSLRPHARELVVHLTSSVVSRLRTLATVTFALAIFGYLVWIGLGFVRGTTPLDLLRVLTMQEGAISALKHVNPPVAGLTTFTQLGPVAVAVMMVLRRAKVRSYTWQLASLLLLAVYRSFFYGERLALIEVGIPIVFLYFAVASANSDTSVRVDGPVKRIVRRTAPFFAIPAIWAVFAIFEYSRSWLYYRNLVHTSFVEYISTRLAGYYVTTANNSAMYHEQLADRVHDPYFSFAAIWDGPGLSRIVGSPEIQGQDPRMWWDMTLLNNANPEFNNQGTFLVTDADLGTPLSMIYWLVIGLVIGYLFHRAAKGSVAALIAYSVVIMGLLEVSRIIYWSQGRFIPIALGLLAVAVVIPGPRSRTDAVAT